HSIFFFQAEDGIRDRNVTGVQTCALPIYRPSSCNKSCYNGLIPACSHLSAMKLSEATDALERVGLGRYEALVFVNLARAGAATAGEVARVSGVNRVQTYRALESLEARGLA